MAAWRSLLALVTAIVVAAPVRAEAPRVRIQAATQLADAGLLVLDGYQDVRGRVLDDLANPIASKAVTLAFSGGDPSGVTACDGFATPVREGPGWALTTDAEGAFCLRATGVLAGQTATLTTSATRYFAALEATFPLQPRRQSVRLSFDAPVLEAALDRPAFVTWVSAEPGTAGGYGTPLRVTVTHTQRQGASEQVAALDIQVGARARLEIPSKALGKPGIGELVVEHAGSPTFAPAKARSVLRRVAAVSLSVAGGPGPQAAGTDAELAVGATSVVGAVTSGWIEAVVEGRAAGVGKVEAGVARLTVPLDGARHPQRMVRLRYVSGEPWWLPSEPLEVAIPIAKPNPLRALPWLLVVAAIAAWVVRAWRRPGRGSHPRRAAALPQGLANIELIEEGPPGSGWSGLVLDAHDGAAIAGATVQVIVPTFDGEGLAGATVCDPGGRFVLPDEVPGSGQAHLRVTSVHHSTLVRRMPKPGRVVISVTSRRRALLERLVAWARMMGRPWTRAGEPTPADVARIAVNHGEADVEAWARAVDEAAFGAMPPDEPREREVHAREPRAVRGDDR